MNSEVSPIRKRINAILLCSINVLNYSDRYTLASILTPVQKEFRIENDMAGLLQSVFMIAYMFAAPFLGYLGDRYNRKILLACSIFIWNICNLSCSFITSYWPFIAVRALFGIGQAGFSTVAPTVISDLFSGDKRSMILMCFYLAIPAGQGMGYIIGTEMDKAMDNWRWTLRITPSIGALTILLLFVGLKEPERGQSDGFKQSTTSWCADVAYLFKNKSFLFSTFGFTCIAFAAGALAWWAPKIFYAGLNLQPDGYDEHKVGTILGVISITSGVLGLVLGYLLSYCLRKKYPRIDPLICGVGLFVYAPLVMGATYASLVNIGATFFLAFISQIAINVNWAINVDILLYVVVASRRSLGMGFQLFLGHALGDAESPYLIGVLSDHLRRINVQSSVGLTEFKALQYSMFLGCGVALIGGVLFLLNAYYIVGDIDKVLKLIEDDVMLQQRT